MCGFAGFLGDAYQHGVAGGEVLLQRMIDTIIHRGPDDAGTLFDEKQRIGLGHRRLSIVDLSSAGHQPMTSASGRYIVIYNGEIYNHLLLREKLESAEQAPHWRGHSDTETLLAGFDAWGIQNTVERCIGMFAFAVWDRQSLTLTLVRDRIGEKPLYYGWQRGSFLFGSELKALRIHPAFVGQIDRNALCLLLRHNYIPAPYSIYEGIKKLLPGCLLTVSLQKREPNVLPYWSYVQAAKDGIANTFSGSAEQAVDAMEILLKDAVRQQMIADVPLGAFLSGGIDSSTVVALMQAQSSRPVKTFSIGFNQEGYNEAKQAKNVASHLGTDHTELYVTPEQAMSVIPCLPTLYDEPFADSSQIPTYLVSRLARQHVTVSLSGDGGDELFCGYRRYLFASNLWQRINAVPKLFRSVVAKGIMKFPVACWDLLGAPFSKLLSKEGRKFLVGDKLYKGSGLLASNNLADLYFGLVSHQRNPGAWVINGHEPPTHLKGMSPPLEGLDELECMMAMDAISYLPDDILVKVDRAAMGVSLESRIPLLDHRVVEFAWTLPLHYKLRNGKTKWPLRKVLYRYVPHELVERPKMGFGIPLHDWLRGPLRDWCEALLDESRLFQEGFFSPAPIRKMWLEHVNRRRNWAHHLWSVLMFQAWLENDHKRRIV